MDEFDLIERYFRPLSQAFAGAFNLTDDAARVAAPTGEVLVVTTDMLLEGVHFFGSEPAHLIAQKALRTNLSDLAAKGAKPLCYFLCVGLSDRANEAWIKDFCQGLAEDQAAFKIALAGGDTNRSKAGLVISITAMGSVPEHKMRHRAGAKKDEILCVSGTLGDAALGLAILKGEFPDMPENLTSQAISRYHLPQPRCSLGVQLRDVATASMDISDGLFQDASHMLKASQVGAIIEVEKIPQSPAMQWVKGKNPARWLELLGSGDDYELLFTAKSVALPSGTTQIGMMTDSQKLVVHDKGNPITPPASGYRHRPPGREVGP